MTSLLIALMMIIHKDLTIVFGALEIQKGRLWKPMSQKGIACNIKKWGIIMKIQQFKISNFRLLKDFSIDLENNLSLIIGKNNTGKTSFLSLLEKFLKGSKNSFSFEDFNLAYQNK